MTIKDKLIAAATEYDRQQSRKRFYNPYGLGIMFQAIDAACQDIDRGAPVRAALLRAFSDRILDRMLKAVGERPFTREESNSQPIVYIPVTQ